MCRKLLAGVLTFLGAWVLASCSDQGAPTAPKDPKPTFTAVAAGDAGGVGIPATVLTPLGDRLVLDPATMVASGSSGSDVQCNGALPPGEYDNIVVPMNQLCIIFNSTVRGSVKALENAELQIIGGTTVHGSVYGDKAFRVFLFNVPATNRNIVRGNIVDLKEVKRVAVCGATLTDGNIQIEKASGTVLVGGVRCTLGFGNGNVLEKGNVKVEDNFLTPVPGQLEPDLGLQIGDNVIAQNLQVSKNRGPLPKTVSTNTVGENLQCFDNEGTFVGGPNTAPKKEGQCF